MERRVYQSDIVHTTFSVIQAKNSSVVDDIDKLALIRLDKVVKTWTLILYIRYLTLQRLWSGLPFLGFVETFCEAQIQCFATRGRIEANLPATFGYEAIKIAMVGLQIFVRSLANKHNEQKNLKVDR
ncbi:hypothetical protein VA249_33150 [Vibrio alfacsensis]|nr:hypothetical protein VA249_33150 [Vibrio alfacsensis]